MIANILEAAQWTAMGALFLVAAYLVPIFFRRWREGETDRALFAFGVALICIGDGIARAYWAWRWHVTPDPVTMPTVAVILPVAFGALLLIRQATKQRWGERCWLFWLLAMPLATYLFAVFG